jgi:hypothetical protein
MSSSFIPPKPSHSDGIIRLIMAYLQAGRALWFDQSGDTYTARFGEKPTLVLDSTASATA